MPDSSVDTALALKTLRASGKYGYMSRHRKYTVILATHLPQTGKCHSASDEISDSPYLHDAGRTSVLAAGGGWKGFWV